MAARQSKTQARESVRVVGVLRRTRRPLRRRASCSPRGGAEHPHATTRHSWGDRGPDPRTAARQVRPTDDIGRLMTLESTVDDTVYVRAMSHPLRLSIMTRLAERASSPVGLARQLGASLGVVAYHVRTLHRLGLLELVEERPVRGSIEHHYRARPPAEISEDALASPSAADQGDVRRSLQQVTESVRIAAECGGFDHAEAHLARTRSRMDRHGWEHAARACSRLVDELDQIQRSAAERLETEQRRRSPPRRGHHHPFRSRATRRLKPRNARRRRR